MSYVPPHLRNRDIRYEEQQMNGQQHNQRYNQNHQNGGYRQHNQNHNHNYQQRDQRDQRDNHYHNNNHNNNNFNRNNNYNNNYNNNNNNNHYNHNNNYNNNNNNYNQRYQQRDNYQQRDSKEYTQHESKDYKEKEFKDLKETKEIKETKIIQQDPLTSKPTFIRRNQPTQSTYIPKQTYTPQPSKSPSTFYKQSNSSNPSFTRQPRVRDRWSDYIDSREDPQRDIKRQKWLEETKEERENLRDVTQEYDKLEVEVTGEKIPKQKFDNFYDIDLGQELDENILKAGYYHPMPVQKATIPIVLNGRDLMSCAQTGSGKTAAFLFPIISNILRDPPIPRQKSFSSKVTIFPIALILAPTRELGQQIYDEAVKFSENTPLRSVCVYGGQEPYHQIQEMGKGCEILVATPGRLLHFLERRIVSLSSIRYLVLDEADRMLDMGFEPQIRDICNNEEMPRIGERQTLMFSATFPKQIQKLAQDFLDDYIFITIGKAGSTCDTIDQRIIWVEEHLKNDAILDVLDEYKEDGLIKGVIFVETKRGADILEDHLYRHGYKVDSIHGDRSQSDRDYSLKRFKDNIIQLLVATDVASRGLDIPDIDFVINYDMPKDIESYVHRIGRTGRAGKKGVSISFLNRNTQGMIPQLVPLLEESGQEIPNWFDDILYEMHQAKLAKRREQQQQKGMKRGGYRFGGRDRRYDNRGGRRDDGDLWDGNRSMSTPVRAQMFD